MENATPQTQLISREAARLIWEDLLPGAPATGTALEHRSRRGTGPPLTSEGEGPAARVGYDPAAVREWCLAQQPAAVRRALLVAERAELLMRLVSGRRALRGQDQSFTCDEIQAVFAEGGTS